MVTRPRARFPGWRSAIDGVAEFLVDEIDELGVLQGGEQLIPELRQFRRQQSKMLRLAGKNQAGAVVVIADMSDIGQRLLFSGSGKLASIFW